MSLVEVTEAEIVGETLSVTLSDGSKVTPAGDTSVVTSTDATGPVFFQYTPSGGKTITGFDLLTGATNAGLVRFDDLGFVTAAASGSASAPEPTMCVSFAIGLIGIGLRSRKARQRGTA